jgi:hypothetical protein
VSSISSRDSEEISQPADKILTVAGGVALLGLSILKADPNGSFTWIGMGNFFDGSHCGGSREEVYFQAFNHKFTNKREKYVLLYGDKAFAEFFYETKEKSGLATIPFGKIEAFMKALGFSS